MNLYELLQQMQDNLIAYLDELPTDLVDGACQVLVDTFDKAFFGTEPKGN